MSLSQCLKKFEAIFNEIFEDLDDCLIDKSAHGSFDTRNPLKYSNKGAGHYRCSTCNRSWKLRKGRTVNNLAL